MALCLVYQSNTAVLGLLLEALSKVKSIFNKNFHQGVDQQGCSQCHARGYLSFKKK